jgi:hypothetical protein
MQTLGFHIRDGIFDYNYTVDETPAALLIHLTNFEVILDICG